VREAKAESKEGKEGDAREQSPRRAEGGTMSIPMRLKLAVLALVCGGALLGSSPALAVTGAPQWTVTAVSAPTNLVPGDETGNQYYNVTVTNTGGEPSNGPVTITDTLPEGVTLDEAGAEGFELVNTGTEFDELGPRSSCEGVSCTFSESVVPEAMLLVRIPIDVNLTGEQTVTNVVHVSGGGAPDVFVRTPTLVSSTPAGYGIPPGSTTVSLSDSQAGAHADLTNTIGYNTVDGEGEDAGDQKEASVVLPPGFGGDLVDTPTCSVAKFSHEECPIGTQIGVATVLFAGLLGHEANTVPVYNLAAEPADVAKIGFPIAGGLAHVQADITVLPGTYQLKTTFHNINALVKQNLVSVTIWGVPTEASHDDWRWNGGGPSGKFGASSSNARVPYLASPTSCSGEAQPTKFQSVSWQEPDAKPAEAEPLLAPLDDCDRLGLESTFTAVPTTTSAYAPTGLNVELGVRQTNENPEGLAASALKKAVVTLPEGMTVNPSAGVGLGACTRSEYEAERLETPVGEGCPIESKLGTVHIKTPALNEEGSGSVYLATPYANPFSEEGHPDGSLLALYVVARFPVRGVTVKVAGKVSADPITGRLVTAFEGVPSLDGEPSLEGLPPVPFSSFVFQFHQGETSPLVSPPACGNYSVRAELIPWSEPAETLVDVSSPFEITSSFDAGACPSGGVPPFKPEVSAGTLDNDAGSYSPFEIRITRGDGEQEITGFASQLPAGLIASLTGVPFCSEADIALAGTKTGAQEETEPACPAASQIGRTLVGAGVGEVLADAPGGIYMAGPFDGAPFSVVAITSAKVGPFDLGTVVVHLPLLINPITAAVSIPAGAADQIPHIIRGIVIHVRDIRVFIERPDFTINPTNCDPTSFSATVIGGGMNPTDIVDEDPVTVSNPFQAADCQSLQFKPGFKVTTSGKTSRADGANLSVRLTYPNAPQGTQANIKEVKVDLPKQLPSRLTTLQKACTDAQFEANPAGCPPDSIVGHATANTPILPVPLTGPAYFVSHGGAKFPELIIVLQGYGVTLQLHGETFISKAGITSSTFHEIPDAPVGSFELTLPEGPDSALAANGNLCSPTNTVTVKKKETIRVKGHKKTVTRKVTQTTPGTLQMPTLFVAQNGDIIKQNTPITVSNCPKAAKAKSTKKSKHGKKGK
jgi:uncharacterized repeat protein (TIGR01451 family)